MMTMAGCTYEGCPYPLNPKYNHDHPPDLLESMTKVLGPEELLYLPRDVMRFGPTVQHVADLLVTITDRERVIERLQYALERACEDGWGPESAAMTNYMIEATEWQEGQQEPPLARSGTTDQKVHGSYLDGIR